MSVFNPKLYFYYLAKLYAKNLLAILFGLAFAFAAIDYFQHVQRLNVAGNYKILYIFYMWQESLGLVYPLAIVFGLIMTKLSLVKNNTMGALHAFGYSKKKLLVPFMAVATGIYIIFALLHTTEFSYAKEKAAVFLNNKSNIYNVNNLFFKYNDTFVYIKKLDPIHKRIDDITIFKVEGYQIRYTINAPLAVFDGEEWDAQDAILKTHIYNEGQLDRYTVEHKKRIKTLKGYKPKIIESLYDGKALNIIDAFFTWRLLASQSLNSSKVRASLYNKVITPLFALAMLLILFFKLPFYARETNLSTSTALALGSVIGIWGMLFGLERIGYNGVIAPELTSFLPIGLLIGYALYLYQAKEYLHR